MRDPDQWALAPRSGGPPVLAIESSCDETAAAVLTGTCTCASSIVHTQVALHARFGGVVPEIASRAHLTAIEPVVADALREAGIRARDLAAIAVTRGPGLGGALLVGVEFAKGLGASLGIPVVGVHHIEGHLLAPLLEVASGFDPLLFPHVALVVSGGHTSLVLVHAPGQYTALGRTLDDAAGEAYDKVSKRMGLGYPGGAVIDRLAKVGRADAYGLPRPMVHRPGYDFSFSGLKTAVGTLWDRMESPGRSEQEDMAASFQEAVVETLGLRTLKAAKDVGVRHVSLTGGVACNSRLRSWMRAACDERGWGLSVAPPRLCSDNAAMIGAAGYSDAWFAAAEGCTAARSTLDAQGSWGLGTPLRRTPAADRARS